MELSNEQNESWLKNGYLKIAKFFSDADKSNIVSWVDEIEGWPEIPGKWMKYFETTGGNDRQLCRIENFLQYHEGFNRIARGQETIKLLSAMMGE